MYRGLGGILPALLALVLSSGGGLAAGDLFDDDYRDCPARTRLREGQIADLAVARDAEEEAEVNVSWAATDPASWGLGPNTYRTSLVLLLDDGTQKQTRTVALGTRKVAFDKVDTGVEVTVQMAIVVATADGDYLISDILEQDLHQSLTAPAFHTDILRVTTAATVDDPNTDVDETALETAQEEETEKTRGTFYYVGYNEHFGNYRKHPDGTAFPTRPTTPRFRLGLAHAAQEDDDAREAVDFDAYIVRITDPDGDVVPEGHDVATVATAERDKNRFDFGISTAASLVDANTPMFSNVRINDGGTIRPAMQADDALDLTGSVVPATIGLTIHGVSTVAASNQNAVFARWPDEHRDFPVDVLASDETYTITAWAVNDDRDVISPVASLQVRPADRKVAVTVLLVDYAGATTVGFLYITDFTVLK